MPDFECRYPNCDCLRACQATGRAVGRPASWPDPVRASRMVRALVSEETWRKFKAQAARLGKTVEEHLGDLVMGAVGENDFVILEKVEEG